MNQPVRSVRLELCLVRGPRVLRTWHGTDEMVVGSSPDCTVTLRGSTALRERHLSLLVDDGLVTLVAEEGAVVRVNGVEVDVAVVSPTDRIETGGMTFVARLSAREHGDAEGHVGALRVRLPSGRKRTARLKPGRFLVGSERAHLVLAEAGVAPRHVQLEVDARGQVRVSAFAQESFRFRGALVQEATLQFGDDLEVGPVRLSWHPLAALGRGAAELPAARDEDDEDEHTVSLPVRQRQQIVPSEPESGLESAPAESLEDLAAAFRAALAAEEQDRPPSSSRVRVVREPAPKRRSSPTESARVEDLEHEPEQDLRFDDDDDDQEDFEEPFDLARILLAARGAREAARGRKVLTVSLVRIRHGRVQETLRLFPDGGYISEGRDVMLHVGDARVAVTLEDPARGMVSNQGDLAVDVGSEPTTLMLSSGDAARVRSGEDSYAIEVFHALAELGDVRPMKPTRKLVACFGGALLLHLVGLTAAQQVDPTQAVPHFEEEAEEVFATISLDMPTAPTPATAAGPAPAAAPQAASAPRVSIPRAASSSAPTPTVGKLLASLSAEAPRLEGLAALRQGADETRSPDLLAGLAQLGAGHIDVARVEGGVGPGTGEAAAAARAKGTLSSSAAPGGRAVRGKVTRVSSQARVEGQLSREEVSAVVSKHIQKVQACYERALIASPELSGRIVFDWTVSLQGRVRGLRVQTSTLSDASVASCVRDEIRGWVFPKPQGGEVTISYPFLFRSSQL